MAGEKPKDTRPIRFIDFGRPDKKKKRAIDLGGKPAPKRKKPVPSGPKPTTVDVRDSDGNLYEMPLDQFILWIKSDGESGPELASEWGKSFESDGTCDYQHEQLEAA